MNEIRECITLHLILTNKPKTKMKKVLSLVVLGAAFAIYSCGPSAEEKAKMEQARQDSIAQVEAANKAAEEAAAMQAMEKARQDSIAQADSAAKAAGTKAGKKK
jgi:Pyruvate/2-oxoacid:ferredoxin oxidoreductase gamma subunit